MATPGAIAEKEAVGGINSDYKEKFGFHDSETGYAYKAPKGLNKEIVESISDYKKEPEWMRDFRLKAYDSAILYLKGVVATYPRAAIAPEALIKLVEAYRKVGYREDVQETCGYIRRFHPGARGTDEVCPQPTSEPS